MAANKVDGVGLALAGGGWRSYAQVAVLADMEANGIPVGAVAGTSMGSLVATLTAAGLSSTQIEDLLLKMDVSVEEAGIVKNMRRHVISAVNRPGLRGQRRAGGAGPPPARGGGRGHLL